MPVFIMDNPLEVGIAELGISSLMTCTSRRFSPIFGLTASLITRIRNFRSLFVPP